MKLYEKGSVGSLSKSIWDVRPDPTGHHHHSKVRRLCCLEKVLPCTVVKKSAQVLTV
jgi:hypothetical protein